MTETENNDQRLESGCSVRSNRVGLFHRDLEVRRAWGRNLGWRQVLTRLRRARRARLVAEATTASVPSVRETAPPSSATPMPAIARATATATTTTTRAGTGIHGFREAPDGVAKFIREVQVRGGKINLSILELAPGGREGGQPESQEERAFSLC